MGTNYDKLKEIFLSAYDTEPSEERSRFLDRACEGNPELRAHLEALFAACARPADLIDVPAASFEPTKLFREVNEQPGSMVGPYKLLQQIGEGGMGLVFMAEQQQPVKRKVALKVIKPGMDSRQVVARFEAERQTLALMNHPNIAQVFDAGTTESGRPYFVMELVRGVPITQYCDQNNQSPAERLELFVTVCHAIQHAHQKGVIHRDIKPTNVLVTLHDGRPIPKVIDFGIAKAINQEMTERTLFTNFAQLVGTPLYMSPEQAEMSGLDIDTRADIYSLGVLLYELLTGQTPFDKARLRGAAYDEICRILREEEPPRPSTRLSTLGEQLTAVSSHRRTDPRRLSRLVRGDLDWIVMKSLEKDRTRRYATASEFAADILRHLNHEAVLASPPSVAYRLSKFMRKHRGAVGAGAAVVLALTCGLAASLALYARSERLRGAAVRAEGLAVEARQAEQHRALELEEALGRVTTERNQKEQALEQKHLALARSEAQRLAALSANVLPQDPGLALVLATEAAARMAHLPTVNNALLAALNECREARTLLVRPPISTDVIRPLSVRSVAYSTDGSRLLTVSHGKVLHRSQANARTELFGEFQGPETLTSTHHVLVSVAHMWQAATGNLLATLRAPPNQLFHTVVLSPDGRVAAATFVNSPLVKYRGGQAHFYTNRVVRLYDTSTGEQFAILKGHADRVVSAAFSPDGARIATASWDKTARVWEVSTGAPIDALRIRSLAALDDARYSPDGRFILTHSAGLLNSSSYADDPNAEWAGRDALLVDPPSGVQADVRDLRSGDLGRSSRGFSLSAASRAAAAEAALLPGARLWDARTGAPIEMLINDEEGLGRERVTVARFGPSGWIATGGHKGTIRAGAINAAQQLVTWKSTAEAAIDSLEFSPDGTRLLVGYVDGTLAVVDLSTGTRQASAVLRAPGVRAARFSKDGRQVIVVRGTAETPLEEPVERAAAKDVSRWLWMLDTQTLKETALLKGHADQVFDVVESPDGNFLATASADGTARIWHALAIPKTGVTINGAGQGVPMPSPDGRLVVTSTLDLFKSGQARGLARVYSTTDGALVSELTPSSASESKHAAEGHGELLLAHFSPDGQRLLTVSNDRHVHILAPEEPGVSRASLPLEKWPLKETLAPHPVRVWDVGTGRELFALAGLARQVDWAQWSPDGARLLTRSNMRFNYCHIDPKTGETVASGNQLQPEAQPVFIRVWDAFSGRLLMTASDELNPTIEWHGSIGWGPGRVSVAASNVMGWLDLDEGRRVNVPNMFSSDELLFSNDHKWLLVHNREQAHLFDTTRLQPLRGVGKQHVITRHHADGRMTESRELEQLVLLANPVRLEGDVSSILAARFSPDGRHLAAANTAGRVQAWEAATGRLLFSIQGHLQHITDLHYSRDGRLLVTTSEDRNARVWNAQTGAELLTLEGHTEPVRAAQFTADGRYVVTASDDGTARTWPVDPLQLAQARKPRDLTSEERARFELEADDAR
jgi:WD40 repeat protein/serine/threonine protein kinase